MTVPASPKIYHITHVSNLPKISLDGGLYSDLSMIARGGPASAIGMSTIKQRRIHLPVKCHPAITVGGCVPFYFCPRSVMLYVISRQNHPEMTYTGGQGPIVHLEADLMNVVNWADQNSVAWAFTLQNAGAVYADFRSDLSELHEVDWGAVNAKQWGDPSVKEAKQAEFLLSDHLPWNLIDRIGVQGSSVADQARNLLTAGIHKPQIQLKPDWYY